MNKLLIFGIGVLIVTSCASLSQAPKGEVPTRETIMEDAHGSWVKIYRKKRASSAEGELLAVEGDRLYIINNDKVSQVTITTILYAQVIVYSVKSGSKYLKYPKHNWKYLSRFARFPGGFPDGIEVTSLKSRKNNFKTK